MTYTPRRRFTGDDSFTYRASDGVGRSRRPPRSRSRHARPGVRRRLPPHRAGRAGLGAADLHRSGRRPAHALDRRRPVEGLAGRDLGRRGDLHAGRRRVRRRLVHATARTTARRTPPGDRLDHDQPRADCDDVARTTAVGEPVSVPLTCTDPDGDALTLSIVDGAVEGLAGRDRRATRSPTRRTTATSAPTRSPTARATARRAADPATVSITVTRAPSCDDVARTTAAGDPVSVPLTCTDPDGDALTLAIEDGPSKGSLGAISGGSVTYTPDAGEFGADTFTYTASDGAATSAPATATITITRPPSCQDVARRTAAGSRGQRPADLHGSRRRSADARRSSTARRRARWARSRAAR